MQGKRSSEVHRINCCINMCEKMNVACKTGHFYFLLFSIKTPVIYNVYQYKKIWKRITFGLDASSPDVQFLRAPAASPAGGQDVASPWAAAAAASASVMKRHHPVDSQLRGTNASITSSGDAMAQIKHGKQTLSGNGPYFCFILTENSCPIEPHFPSAKQTRCNAGVTNVKSSFQTASLLHPTATAP